MLRGVQNTHQLIKTNPKKQNQQNLAITLVHKNQQHTKWIKTTPGNYILTQEIFKHLQTNLAITLVRKRH